MDSDNRQLTMKDIAQALGVSVATVSRALSDSPSISKDRRAMIQQYARDHNVYPNVIAAQLRHSKREPLRVIGVIMPEVVHYYFASILAGIDDEAAARDYRIIIATSHEQYDREVRICESFLHNKVCGVIVSQSKSTLVYDHFIDMAKQGLPLVFFDRICPALNASRVVVDDYKGTFNAVSHMIESGCRRVAFYGTAPNLEININRYNGYKDAIYHNGLTPDKDLVKMCDNRADSIRITPEMLSMDNPPDAIFAVNDEAAIGALYVAKRMGIKVPEQLSICGFTNTLSAMVCDPQLTSVEQDGRQVGKEAADILIGLVEGKYDPAHAVKRIVKTKLVIRETTR